MSLTLVPLVFLSFSRQGVSPRVGSLTASTPKSRDFLKNHIRKSARTRKARARAVETSCNVRGGVMYACAPHEDPGLAASQAGSWLWLHVALSARARQVRARAHAEISKA